MVKLADTQDSGSCARKGVEVRVLSGAPLSASSPKSDKRLCVLALAYSDGQGSCLTLSAGKIGTTPKALFEEAIKKQQHVPIMPGAVVRMKEGPEDIEPGYFVFSGEEKSEMVLSRAGEDKEDEIVMTDEVYRVSIGLMNGVRLIEIRAASSWRGIAEVYAVKWRLVVLMLGALAVGGACLAHASETGADPDKRYAYGENIGWVNTGPTGQVVTVHFDGTSGYLSGYAWGENIGWICFPTNGHGGVSLDDSGNLAGYAWGENIGWICFPTNGAGGVSIDTQNGEFSGHAWGENIGWLKFKGSSPDYGVRTLAFDKQAEGTPNWWLSGYGVVETYDEGDNVPAWQEYVADTDPTNPDSSFQVVSVSVTGTTAEVVAWPTSTRRTYTLKQTEDPVSGIWSNVAGQVDLSGAPDTGGEQTLEDVGAGGVGLRHYTVEVEVSP